MLVFFFVLIQTFITSFYQVNVKTKTSHFNSYHHTLLNFDVYGTSHKYFLSHLSFIFNPIVRLFVYNGHSFHDNVMCYWRV